jgi:hypothetical protein
MPSASSALPRPRWGRRLAAATAAAAIALAGTLASELPAHAAPTPFSAGMETGNLREFTATSVSSGALQVTTQRAFSGSRSAHATYTGRGSNGYARGQQDVTWRSGDDVWYGMAVFLPSGFKAAQQGPVDLLRWDNWSIDPNNTDRSGLTLDSRGRLVLLTQQLNRTGYNPLLGGYDVPEGRWVHLEVRQRLSSSSGQAINEVWMDGRRLGSNTSANSYGRNATRLRAGIVAVSAGQQTNNLQLWFDDVTISSSRVGPKGSTSSPSPSPAPSPSPSPSQEPPAEDQPSSHDADPNRVTGDFTGDGQDEVASYEPSTGIWTVTRTVDGRAVSGEWGRFNTRTGWSHHLVGDFNNNGRDDIASYHPGAGTWWVSRSTGNRFTPELWTRFTTRTGWSHHLVGDFNNNGRDDIASYHPGAGTWWRSASTGTDFTLHRW